MTALSLSAQAEPPLGKLIGDICIRLADEGVPVLAIARAIQHEGNAVRRTLHDALAAGTLVVIPRDDWKPGTTRAERVPDVVAMDTDDAKFIINAMRLFKVPPLQARVLALLIRRSEAPKEMIHQKIEQGRHPTKDETDLKMVDVVICNLRKRLKPFGLEIKTIWGRGYFMDPDHRKKAHQLLLDHIKSVTTDPQELEHVGE